MAAFLFCMLIYLQVHNNITGHGIIKRGNSQYTVRYLKHHFEIVINIIIIIIIIILS